MTYYGFTSLATIGFGDFHAIADEEIGRLKVLVLECDIGNASGGDLEDDSTKPMTLADDLLEIVGIETDGLVQLVLASNRRHIQLDAAGVGIAVSNHQLNLVFLIGEQSEGISVSKSILGSHILVNKLVAHSNLDII